MKIIDLFNQPGPVLSFEVFPPKRDGDVETLFSAVKELKQLKPAYISVTYGAGGSTQSMTFEIAERLMKEGLTPLVHFTCVGNGRDEIARQLDRLAEIGVENVLALRGDPPKGAEKFEKPADGFGYANELVAFIRSRWDFCIAVAAYPEVHPDAQSAEHDLKMLKQKIDAGADFVNTQMFFENSRYFDFVERARQAGITQPIAPGVMPVQSARFFERDWGVSVPESLKSGFTGENPEADRAHGLDYATRQCRELLEKGACGLHLYTMNKAAASVKIHQALKT